jgi:hypothetical protein
MLWTRAARGDHLFERRSRAAARVALGVAEHDRALDRRDDQRRESLRAIRGSEGAEPLDACLSSRPVVLSPTIVALAFEP